MGIHTDSWRDLSMHDPAAVGQGYDRLSRLFQHDAFVRMLSVEAINGLLGAIFTPQGHGVAQGDRLRVAVPNEVREAVRRVFAMSPLGLVNEGFIEHVGDLAVFALFPDSVRETVRAEPDDEGEDDEGDTPAQSA